MKKRLESRITIPGPVNNRSGSRKNNSGPVFFLQGQEKIIRGAKKKFLALKILPGAQRKRTQSQSNSEAVKDHVAFPTPVG
jgi:hypothetical protein